MNEVGADEARSKLSTLLDRVESGEEILITRRGKPVARLVPYFIEINPCQAPALHRMRTRASENDLGPMDWDALKSDRDSGRP
jgi:prevent-host-death family protein